MKRRISSVITALALCLTLLPAPALAAGTELDVSAGNVTIDTDGNYTITGSTTTNTITVAEGVTADITLSGVNIDVSGTPDAAAFKIADDSTGNVTVTLVGENTLKSGMNCAGLQKNGGDGTGTLTIKGDGSLNVYGGDQAAGIGGGLGGSGTGICITGGTIKAYGGSTKAYSEDGSSVSGNFGGAGIGGGLRGGGTVTISGNANVTAQGAAGAAGIGACYCISISAGAKGTVIIEGGTVIATGGLTPGFSGNGGAGIGAGPRSHAEVTITGGTVTATGGSSGRGKGNGGAGIGGSGGMGNATVKISGGTVTAKGGDDENGGAGIGGSGSDNVDVTITGGMVTATGGSNVSSDGSGVPGAGIGLNGSGEGSATFSTTRDSGAGDAFIIATGGTGATANGNGITNGVSDAGNSLIVDGETTVWGVDSYTLSQDAEIPAGVTLTIPNGKTLTVNGTLTNNGTLRIDGGTLDGSGTLAGEGKFLTTDRTAVEPYLDPPVVYKGGDQTDEVKKALKVSANILNHEFLLDETVWTVGVLPWKETEGAYYVTFTPVGSGTSDGTKTILLAQSDTTVEVTADKAEYTYGETVTVTATATPTGEAPAKASARLRGAPASGQMALYYGNTQLSEAVGEGEAMTASVKDVIAAGAKYGEAVTLTVKFAGRDSGGEPIMAGAEGTVSVTLKQAPLTVTANPQTITYGNPINQGTDQVTVTGLLTGDALEGVALTASSDQVAVANKTVTPSAAVIQNGGVDVSANYAVTYIPGALTIEKDTSGQPPAAGEGYALDYAAETITVKDGYEVCTAQDGSGQKVTGDVSAYFGQTLYIRKAEDSNHTASGFAAFTLAARPAAPTLTGKNETLLGQKDGAVTAAGTGAMEYRLDGGAWTDVPADGVASGLPGGAKVEVRVKAVDGSAPASLMAEYTIEKGAGITVTFDQGTRAAAGMPDNLSGQSYGTKLTKPADPKASNDDFAFAGWYDGETAWNFETPLTVQSVTLTAKWKQVKFKLAVTVLDNSTPAQPVDGAKVTLKKGNEAVESGETADGGKFTFAKSVPIGAYNVVMEYNGQTKTSLVTITNADVELPVSLPPEGVNSTLTVKGADTPAVVVGGLDEEAVGKKGTDVTKVTVSMTVEARAESQAAEDAIKAAATPTGGSAPAMEFLDVTLTAEITKISGSTETTETENLKNTSNVIELVVPFSFQGKTDVKVYLYHEENGTGSAAGLTELTSGSPTDGTYQLDEGSGLIHIYTKKFSTIAVSYTASFQITFDPGEGTGGGTVPTNGDGKLSGASIPTPSRSGYTFQGWYTADGEKVTEDTVFKADATVTARWTQNPSTPVTPSGSGGSSSSDDDDDDGYPVSVSTSASGSSHGRVTASPSSAEKGDKVTLNVKPDKGYELDALTVTDSKGNALDVTKTGENKYTFTMPSGKVTVTPKFVKAGTAPVPASPNVFIDVPSDAYYTNAVQWAVERGITGGTTATTFSPYNECTRAQMVTFLWRAAGSPAPKGTAKSFADVDPGAYYYDAVLWAIEQGITSGTTAATFSPNNPVTRGQTVTFLYRFAGSPAASGNAFMDVDSGAYYVNAVSWAAVQGITSGTTATTFSPDDQCTRGQTVTFLYRYMA